LGQKTLKEGRGKKESLLKGPREKKEIEDGRRRKKARGTITSKLLRETNLRGKRKGKTQDSSPG